MRSSASTVGFPTLRCGGVRGGGMGLAVMRGGVRGGGAGLAVMRWGGMRLAVMRGGSMDYSGIAAPVGCPFAVRVYDR